jgi:hypothetical protein
MFSIVAGDHALLIYEIQKIGQLIRFSDKDNVVAKISRFYSFAMLPWQQ